MVSALCSLHCGADDTCCAETKIELAMDQEDATDHAQFPDGDVDECDCPGCHVHVIPEMTDDVREFSPAYFAMSFRWEDLILNPYQKSIFHPPSC